MIPLTDGWIRPRRRLRPGTAAFSALIGLLAALPTFGIDMILPSLPDTAAALRVPSSAIGSAMGIYLLSLGIALLVYGPLSDRLGRRPTIIGGCLLLIGGSLGCLAAQTLPQLLLGRAVQGFGAAGPGLAAMAIVRDVSEGETARARMSFVVLVINVVPTIAPTVGAALMGLGGWRLIHAAPIAASLAALVAVRHVDETARCTPSPGLNARAVLQGYARILADPVFRGNALCNAASAGAVFAYITGSALVFIDAFGVSPQTYGIVFGASSLSVMAGAFLNGRLVARGGRPRQAIGAGLALATAVAAILMGSALAGRPSPGPVVVAMVGTALAFGLISPNALHGATEPMPEAAGAASGVAICLQMLVGALASDGVARTFDGRSALSMAAVMLGACLAAIAAIASLPSPAAGRSKPRS
ncbi:multidrug effflux MFS transporter [Methylobacterium sp. ARG-1]|uniref:multidrug effflux MFS transporter n=1 Tax=Methylobacterium sp. ARG-1 TaxID=1692501 RepID=UPI0006810F20|nr:multidrug effflux MFS transporter [Methylobacterium sp. ARG-1]KNY22316.1 multidrug transporter CflA [Methylobacterium sp. ARG-1]